MESNSFIKLSRLLGVTGIKELSLKPVEAKLLFDIPEKLSAIEEFVWNVSGCFVKGIVDKKIVIYPPDYLVKDHIENVSWHPNALIAASIAFFAERLTSAEFLEKIQGKLDRRFELLSSGQAKTVIKRFLGEPLTSTERNDIYKINKKLDNCRSMINTFDGILSKKQIDEQLAAWTDRTSTETYTSTTHITNGMEKLHFFCFECKTTEELPFATTPITPPMHHGKPMALNWGAQLRAQDVMQGLQELENVIKSRIKSRDLIPDKERSIDDIRKKLNTKTSDTSLYCTVCNEFFDIEHDLRIKINQSRKRIKLPFHHEKEMEIRIGERIADDEKRMKFKNISLEINKARSQITDQAFYMCMICHSVRKLMGEQEIPMHHDETMTRIFLQT